MKQKQL